jgi:hypothetical protein
MFEIFCPTHNAQVLLSERRIERLRNTVAGPAIDGRCWCNTRGSTLMGGRRHAHAHAGVAP